jgi:hypothetical protein
MRLCGHHAVYKTRLMESACNNIPLNELDISCLPS